MTAPRCEDCLYLDISDLVCIKRDESGEQWMSRKMLGEGRIGADGVWTDKPLATCWYPEGEEGLKKPLDSEAEE
jgi:hypothetical protein